MACCGQAVGRPSSMFPLFSPSRLLLLLCPASPHQHPAPHHGPCTDRWRDEEGGEQESRRKAGRSHSLSPYASPHSLDLIPTLPPPSNMSTFSLLGPGLKDVKKGFSVDNHGFLEKPQSEPAGHADDQRRHSIEVCLPQAVITTDSQIFMLETHRSEKGAQAFPVRVQSPHAPLLPTVMPFSQTVVRHSPLAGDCIPLPRFTFDQPQSRYTGEPESAACSSPFDNRLGSSPGFSAKNRRTAQ
ncbi:hypothetical protein GOODEAATRI_018424 [Goodea atripinnis]|uniref:Uncharacterized protein n=1 Tax=Goodea atripinnis TaxID=208336 RepID=A0ABV0PPV8_9TELE